MLDKLRIRFTFLPTTDEEKAQGIIRAKVHPNYIADLHAYGMAHRGRLDDQEAVLKDWNWEFNEEARKFYFAIRDAIVEAQSGRKTSAECTKMHKDLKKEFGARDSRMKIKSLKDAATEPYTRRELWMLVQGALDWLEEAGGSLAGSTGDYKMLRDAAQEE